MGSVPRCECSEYKVYLMYIYIGVVFPYYYTFMQCSRMGLHNRFDLTVDLT